MALSEQAALNKDKRNAMSDMQHRHFATVAYIINRMEKVSNQEHGFIDIRDDVADHFAAMLGRTNPRFDRARFLAACRED